MATTPRSSSTPAAVWSALTVLMALSTVATTPAGASTLTVFGGPGCTGETESYTCGCHDIVVKPQGGMRFEYTDYLPVVFFDENAVGSCSRRSIFFAYFENYEYCRGLGSFNGSVMMSCPIPLENIPEEKYMK